MSQGPDGGQERQLALLVTSALDYAIFMLDLDGVVLTWNRGAERMQGYQADEIIGRHFSTFYTEEDRARAHPDEELRLARRDGRYEEEGWRVRKDGTRFWANIVITALRDETGELVGFGKVSRDLTVRRLAEEQTRAKAHELEVANRQLDEYRRLVASVRDYAIFMLDPGGHILTWNRGARHLKGYAPEEIIGRHFSTFYTAADKARSHPAHELDIASREGRYAEEGWRVRKDGTTFWASVTITAVRDDEGNLTGFAKVTRDLTERKASEDSLRDVVDRLRRANQELDRFTSVAAHDMTDPLRTISGFAELLVETDPAADDAREYARHILTTSQRLSGMLRGLLTYARAGRPEAETQPVALAAAARDAVADVNGLVQARGAEVSVEVPAEAVVRADPNDVRLVLQNLVSNAIKFGADDGPVVSVDAARVNGRWQVGVADNGPGIAPDDRTRIFEAFERTATAKRSGGYGLGLAICARVVARNAGTLDVDSNGQAGSRFHFTLPAAGAGQGSTLPPISS